MAKKFEKKKYSHREWVDLATKTFGDDSQEWAFVCPICGHVAKVKDWVAVGAPEGAIAFNCLGRYLENPRVAFGGTGPGPCNYTGGGLFKLNPVEVEIDGEIRPAFDFAYPPVAVTNPGEMSSGALESGATEEILSSG